MGQSSDIDQKKRNKMSCLLIPMSSVGGGLNENPTKKLKLRGLKLRGLTQNHIGTPNYIKQNDQHKKIYTFDNFGRETPTGGRPRNF